MMSYPSNITPTEIKLFYQTYGEKNSKPQDAILLNPDLDQKFAQDVIDDLVGKGLWDESFEAQLENNQFYFKVFRDDEDMIPVDAIKFENVRMLPNRGLLDLDEPIQNALSRSANWFGSFIPESIKQTAYDFGNSLARWTEDKLTGLSAYSSIPKVEELDEDVWRKILEENSEERHCEERSDAEEIVGRIKRSGSDKTIKENVGSVASLLDPTYERIKTHEETVIDFSQISFVESLLNAAWNFASYAYNNPFKTFTLALAAYSIANRVHLPKMKFENPALDFTNGVSAATGILSKLAVAQLATRGQMHSPLNAILTGMSLWNPVAATGPEFQVNTYTTDDQNTPRVASLTDGTFVVSWQSNLLDGSNYSIYAQRFSATENATATKLGSEFLVNTYTTDNQFHSSIASLTDGSFLVDWFSNSQDGSSNGVYAQRFNATGTLTPVRLGEEFLVNTQTVGNQADAAITSLPDGSFVVTWISFGQDGPSWGVYAQRFLATGNTTAVKLGEEFLVNTHTIDNQIEPAIASLKDGSFVVTWYSNLQDGSDTGVYAQRFNVTGNTTAVKLGEEFLVNTYTTGIQELPTIASLQDGSFVITWKSFLQDGSNAGVYAQRFNAIGNTTAVKLGTEFLVNTYTTNAQISPAIAALPDGNFVVTWMGEGQGDDTGIYAQRFSAGGIGTPSKLGKEFLVNTGDIPNGQFYPTVAALPDNSFVVTWQSVGQDGGGLGSGIYARIFTPPTLINNTLNIYEGQTRLITNTELSAYAPKTELGSLIYSIANVTNGRFELISNQGVAINNFNQSQITNNQIQFVHTGGRQAPSYLVKVNELVLDTNFEAAKIIFDTYPQFQVNTYTMNNQAFPSVATLPDNSFIVAWNSNLQDGSERGIYAQRFKVNVNGIVVKVGAEFSVNTYTTNHQWFATVATLYDGSFLITWNSNLQDGSDYGVYAQRFNVTDNATPIKLGEEFLVNTYTTNAQVSARAISTLSDGSFIVCWNSFLQDGSDYGIYAQRFNATANSIPVKLGEELFVNTYTTGQQASPGIVSFLDNNFIVTWAGIGPQDSDTGIYAQRFSASGNSTAVKIGADFLVNTYTTNLQVGTPPIATLSNNSFIITWQSNLQDGAGYGIYAQRFSTLGNTTVAKMGEEFLVNTYTTNYQTGPNIAALSKDIFVVVWASDLQDGSVWGTYAQRFDATKTETPIKLGSEFLVNTYTTGEQSQATVAALRDGSFVVTWHSADQDGSGYGIYGRLFNPPKLINNTLNIHEGQTKFLTETELSASAPNTLPGTLLFTVSNITNGRFQFVTAPGVPIFNFTQQHVIGNHIQFVHNGGETSPSYYVKVNEEFLDTNFESANIAFTNVNDAPVLTGAIATPLIFTEKNPAIIIDSSITIFDADNLYLTNATVRFLNTVLPEDVLNFTAQGGISGSYSSTTGMLTLMGTSLVSNYQSILQGVKYVNPSLNPSNQQRTVSFRVNDGQLDSNEIIRLINVMPVNDPPVLVNKTLRINQGQTIVITTTQLGVSDPDNTNSQIMFLPSDMQHGLFYRTPFDAILDPDSFTQQEVIDGLIRFKHDGGTDAPECFMKVSDGEFFIGPDRVTVNYNGRFLPRITVNKLTISQRGTIIFSSAQLDATDDDTPSSELTFTISDLENGKFNFVDNPTIFINSFTLQDIMDAKVRFTQNGAEEGPKYKVSVSDGFQTIGPFPAAITYFNVNDAPIVENLIPDRLAENVGQAFSFQVPGNTFFDPDKDPQNDQLALTYSSRMEDGSALPVWINFEKIHRQFTGAPINAGRYRINVIARDPGNATAVTAFTMQVTDSSWIGLVRDLTASLGATLLGLAGAYIKIIPVHRKYNPLAIRVAEHLNLSFIYKIGIAKGLEFSKKIKLIAGKLGAKPGFAGILSMHQKDLKKFEAIAKSIADAILQTSSVLNGYTDVEYCFGKIKGKAIIPSNMTVDETIDEKITSGSISLIAATAEKIYKNGRSIYLMEANAFPEDLNPYMNSYIFIMDQKSEFPDSLFYIDHNADRKELGLNIEDGLDAEFFTMILGNALASPSKSLQEISNKEELKWFWGKVRANSEHFSQVIDGVYYEPRHLMENAARAASQAVSNAKHAFLRLPSPSIQGSSMDSNSANAAVGEEIGMETLPQPVVKVLAPKPDPVDSGAGIIPSVTNVNATLFYNASAQSSKPSVVALVSAQPVLGESLNDLDQAAPPLQPRI